MTVKSVMTAFRLLEEVAARQPVGVSELARLLELPKSTTQRSLSVLRQLGYLQPAPGDHAKWTLTTRAFQVGSAFAGEDIRDAARPVMRALQQLTCENVHLAVASGGVSTLVEKVDGSQAVRTFQRVGNSVPLHACATGKAMLSRMSEAEIRELLGPTLPRFTDHTIATYDRLFAELASVRGRGYAVNRGEWREDVVAVGAAIRREPDEPLAALSLSLPQHRLDEDDIPRLGELVRTHAETIERST